MLHFIKLVRAHDDMTAKLYHSELSDPFFAFTKCWIFVSNAITIQQRLVWGSHTCHRQQGRTSIRHRGLGVAEHSQCGEWGRLGGLWVKRALASRLSRR